MQTGTGTGGSVVVDFVSGLGFKYSALRESISQNSPT